MTVRIDNDNNRFTEIRSESTVGNDAVPPTSGWPLAATFNATQAERLILYWEATGSPPANIDLTLWVYDGYANKYIKGAVLSAVAEETLAVVPCHKTSRGVITVSGVGAPAGANFKIKAYGLRLP
jgi:hypothetical protein